MSTRTDVQEAMAIINNVVTALNVLKDILKRIDERRIEESEDRRR